MFAASSKDYILLSLRIRAFRKVQSSEQTGTASILHISLPVLAAYVVQLLTQVECLHTCNGWQVREQQISKWTYNRNCLAWTAFSAACCVPCLSCSCNVCMHSHCYHSYLLDSATYKHKRRVIRLWLDFARRRLLISSFCSHLLPQCNFVWWGDSLTIGGTYLSPDPST